MKATQLLHDLGQSLWLDNITRDLLDNGTLQCYIDELSVTGLTSNPTIFDQAIEHSELGALLPADGGDCEAVLAQFAKAGIGVDALAAQLQEEGAKSLVNSWYELMEVIASKSAVLEKAS
jgi:hypothetical protein